MKDDDILLLSAYMDKELGPEAAEALERRFEREPELGRCLDQLQATDQALYDTFDSINADPLPAGLEQLLKGDAPEESSAAVLPFPAPAAAPAGASAWKSWPMALAASVALALGVVIGTGMPGPDAGNPLLASDELARMFSERPSGTMVEPDEQPPFSVRLDLSFIHDNGNFCRKYRIEAGAQAFLGIACAPDGKWQNVMLVPAEPSAQEGPDYQPATDQKGLVLIMNYIDEHMQGIALGEEEERQQLEQLAH